MSGKEESVGTMKVRKEFMDNTGNGEPWKVAKLEIDRKKNRKKV